MALPVLSGVDAAAGHTAFSLNDALNGNHLDIDKVLGSLDPVNHVWMDNRMPLLQAGFRVQNLSFRFGAAMRTEAMFSYPGELLELAWKGNGHPDMIGRRLSLDGLGVNAVGYSDLYLGGSYASPDGRFNLGGNLHFLNGAGVIYTENSRFGLSTAHDDYTLVADGGFDVYTAAAISVDTSNYELSPINASPFKGNSGFSMDLGGQIQLGEVSLEAALMNVGWINWEVDPMHYSLENSEFTFSGIDLTDLINNPDSSEAIGEELLDSLENAYTLIEQSESFRTPTNGLFQITARVSPWEGGEVLAGFSMKQRFGYSFTGVHAGVAHQFGHVLTLQAGLQLLNGDQMLYSTGLALRAGPILLYGQVENLRAALNPASARTFQGSAGIMLAFGHVDDPANGAQVQR